MTKSLVVPFSATFGLQCGNLRAEEAALKYVRARPKEFTSRVEWCSLDAYPDAVARD